MEFLFGFVLVILGGLCGGSFGLPAKFAPKDTPWETLWGPFLLFATILVPVIGGPFLANGCFEIYQKVGIAALLIPILCGFLWGIGSILFGLCFVFIGLSLVYAFNCGGQIICGTLGPILIHQPGQLVTLPGIVIILGVVVCIVGVSLSTRAGILRTRSQNQEADASIAVPNLKRTMLGMFLAILSGLLAGCIAIGFSYSDGLLALAEGEPYLNEAWRATIPVTMLILMSGCVPCCLYCAYKLTVNKTWGRFATPSGGVVILIALAMAVIHDSAVVLFGMGQTYLGPLGVSLGYAVFMAFGIIFGNINGFITGEWKGASRQSIQMMICAIVVLILASCVMGLAKALQN
ncbi:MAG: hypothetical protein FWD31_07630 [Planctomycetaceae bacterium]|nr:hypothetical protein [Planctomycetaceae bacterium]